MADDKDVKPGDALTLKVKDAAGDIVHFKIKRTTRFEKVAAAFAQKKGVAAHGVRFMFEGRRLEPAKTPADYDIQDEDQVDAVLEQTGGWSTLSM